MRTTGILLASLVTLLGVIGCAGASLEKQIIGKYAVEIDTSAVKEADKQQAEMAKAFLTGMAIEFKEGNVAVMSMMGQTQDGTYKIEGSKITLTPKSGGQVMTLTSKDGGKTLEPVLTEDEAKSAKGVAIKFKKQ
jgi:hypothetical protein